MPRRGKDIFRRVKNRCVEGRTLNSHEVIAATPRPSRPQRSKSGPGRAQLLSGKQFPQEPEVHRTGRGEGGVLDPAAPEQRTGREASAPAIDDDKSRRDDRRPTGIDGRSSEFPL